MYKFSCFFKCINCCKVCKYLFKINVVFMSEPVKEEHIKVFRTWTTEVRMELHSNSKFILVFLTKLYYCFIQRLVRSDTAFVQALSAHVKQKLSRPSFHCRTQSRPYAAESRPLDWNVFSSTYKLVIYTTITFYSLNATSEHLFT